MSFFIKRLAVIGVGLMGGSLIRALRERDLVGEVVGIDSDPPTLVLATEMGVIDRSTRVVEEGVAGANLVVVATPVCAIVPAIRLAIPALIKGAVVMDVGSVKGSIVSQAEALMPEGVHFVGAHPIAGRERVGVAASFPSLFEGSRTIVTPTSRTAPQALELTRLVWEAVGSRVEYMAAEHHDQVLAATSHLPHLIAYNVVNTLADLENDLRSEVFRYAASGFKDFTRIASSDPSMWRDICLANPEAILRILQRFRAQLSVLERQITDEDGRGLQETFARSKTTRDRVLEENRILHGD